MNIPQEEKKRVCIECAKVITCEYANGHRDTCLHFVKKKEGK